MTDKRTRLRCVGYSLVEILVAVSILSFLLVLVYQILCGMLRSSTVTQWESVLTTQFTNADTRIRSYMDKSSYPSLLTPQGNAILNKTEPSKAGEVFYLLFPGSPDGVEMTCDSVTDGQPLLSWYCCEPGQMGLEGLPDKPPTGTKVELVAKGKRRTKLKGIGIFDLHMNETPIGLASDLGSFLGTTSVRLGSPTRSTLMIGDCRKVALRLIPRGSAKITLPFDERVHVEIEIFCVEPTQGNAERSRKITGQTNVGVRSG